MNVLDVAILVALLGAAAGGYRLGFVARVASWIGLAVGIYLAVVLLPTALRTFDTPDPGTKLAIAAVILLAGAFLGQGLGLILGASLRQFVPPGPLRTVDRSIGAMVGGAGVIVTVWLLLPAIAEVPGAPARQARNSAVARAIDRQLPPPPDTMQVLRGLVGDSDFPRVFEALRPAPVIGPPPSAIGIDPAIVARVTQSTVKVEGQACSRQQEGSGFAVAPDTIATNAHVVAGQRAGRTQVRRPDGRRLDATVVVFDPARDIAVLRVPGLGQAPLPTGSAKVGGRGAVFGHPGGQDQLRVAPAAIRRRVDAVGRDLYDNATTRRDVFILASELRPGDSGGALVDTGGNVVGVAFAIAPDRSATAYALTADELQAALATPRSGPVSTGACLR
ncbi:MAG: MarP family serine protease [Acidimicrobiales bacterium]